jgi:hypothetical protein
MSFLDRLFGRPEAERPGPRGRSGRGATAELSEEQAIERYRYMLRTAPPDDIERAHEEAFAALTPEQRAVVLRELSDQVPPGERATGDDPRSLARMATRAEIRQPGTIERTFRAVPAGPGMGGMFLASLAGAFIGTAIAETFFDQDPAFGGADAATASGDEASADQDVGEPAYGDEPAGDVAGAGDYGGDLGGDFGGGDFGGGDI